MPAPRTLSAALAVLAALLAIPAVRHLREQPPPAPPPIRLALDPPPGTELGSGDEVLDAAISRDERQLAFVATRAGIAQLWHRSFDADRAQAIAGTEGARLPAWNPAGDTVAFFADGRLKTVAIATGQLAELADAPSPSGLAWLPGGSILFSPAPNGPVRILLSDGRIADATTLRPAERGHVFPMSTGEPDDFVYTAVADTGRRTIRRVRRGEDRELQTTSGHGAVVDGRLLYVRDDVLLAQRLAPSALTPEGQAVRLSLSVGVTADGRALFVGSPRLVLTAAAVSRARALTWFDLDGTKIGTSGEPGEYWQVRLSPDDRWAAVTAVAPLLRTLDVVIAPLSGGGAAEALTLALAADSDPVWAPDGRRVLFRSLQTGRPALFVKTAHDRNAEDERVLDADAIPTDWREGSVLFHQKDETSGDDLWSLDPRTSMRRAAVKSGFNDSEGRWSPDGAWLAFVSDESGRPDVYASRRDGTRVRVSAGGGSRPRWARDGRSLFFLRGATIMRSTLMEDAGARFATATAVLEAPGIRDFDVAHRRDALIALLPAGGAATAPVAAAVDWQSSLPVEP